MKNILKIIKDNKWIVLLSFLFILILVTVYLFDWISKNKEYEEDRALGDVETPLDDISSEFEFENAMIYLGRDATIVEWPAVNRVFETMDLGSELDIYSIANKFGLNERGPDDTFEEWVGDWGNLFVYNESIRVTVGKSDIYWEVDKIKEESSRNNYLNTELSNLLGHEFETISFTVEQFENNSGESLLKVEGVYKIDNFSVLFEGWTDNFVTIILGEAGSIRSLQIKRFIPNLEKVGTYVGYSQDDLISNMKNSDIDKKIFKVNIDLASSADYVSDGSYAYLIDLQYDELIVRTITINLMKMTYYVDKETGMVIPMIVISGDISVGTGGGIKSGLYKFEIWHSNVK
ncbi:MAG: hypothetical protein BWY74_03766 [Firmicutes bacterium ADurb.Bin419]|nr:MAG: hypothetical protein BWY74_03766 [Firmicutes bacterium ADurb.Bin419]HOU75697.1 hypothetical protein [Candidatus Dojkabacteria bacterium]HQF36207.1 hypothetical protein [Candidatus Dojkabacteria bacterium]